MIIIGDEYIPFEKIVNFTTRMEKNDILADISTTESNSTILFDFDKNIMKYCMENSIPYGVKITSIKEAIFANSLGAKYLIASNKLIQPIQHLAENYMFDTKVLAIIRSEDDIEQFAVLGVDGVIYKSILG
jgi:hypothetical protein